MKLLCTLNRTRGSYSLIVLSVLHQEVDTTPQPQNDCISVTYLIFMIYIEEK